MVTEERIRELAAIAKRDYDYSMYEGSVVPIEWAIREAVEESRHVRAEGPRNSGEKT